MSSSSSISEFPLAYLLTFTTYGTWLHGEAKGSVDRHHNRFDTDFVPPDKRRLKVMQSRMKSEALILNSNQRRRTIEQAIASVCKHRRWELLAINVRTNHVHVVVSAEVKPEKAMSDFKSWATRRLREAELVGERQKVWSRHGSTRYLWDDRAVDHARCYVVEGQGLDL